MSTDRHYLNALPPEGVLPSPPEWALEYPPLSSYIEWGGAPPAPIKPLPVRREPTMPPLDALPAAAPLRIYTDGACHGNPGPGGWGVLIMDGQKKVTGRGSCKHTTNNAMELMAAIAALEHAEIGRSIVVNIDSQYVRKGITEWIHNWKKNGWKTSAKKPVVNDVLWKRLDAALAKHSNVEWKWVKGHSGNVGNEVADALASEGAAARKDKDTIWTTL